MPGIGHHQRRPSGIVHSRHMSLGEALALQRSAGNQVAAQRIAEAIGASAYTVGDDIVLSGDSADDEALGHGTGHLKQIGEVVKEHTLAYSGGLQGRATDEVRLRFPVPALHGLRRGTAYYRDVVGSATWSSTPTTGSTRVPCRD